MSQDRPGGPPDPSERVRLGLEAARARVGDEVTRRRLWAKVSEATHALPGVFQARPRGRNRGLFVVVVGALAVGAVGAVLVWPSRVREVPSVAVTPPERARAEPVVTALAVPAVVRTGPDETMNVRLAGGTRMTVARASHVELSAHGHPQVVAGQIDLDVPRQPGGRRFVVSAGPFRVLVVGTKFSVSTREDRIEVAVAEGAVHVIRDAPPRDSRKGLVKILAGQSWTGWLSPPTPERPRRARPHARKASVTRAGEGAVAMDARFPPGEMSPDVVAAPPPEREHPEPASAPLPPPGSTALARQARDALAAGDPRTALALLGVLEGRPGPAAENALYERGRILRDHLHKPREALAAWTRYRARHPRGLLRAEVDLSVVETHAALGDSDLAVREAEGFLARHPRSERRGEIERLLAALRNGRAESVR
jgi:hypothetical protein